MKKVLLIGFVLAILLFAFPQGVLAATDDGQATVSARISDYITLTVTNPGDWPLAYDANQCGGTEHCNQGAPIGFTVSSNDQWTVRSLTDTDQDGFMVGSDDASTPLAELLLIGPDVSAGYVDLTDNRDLQTDSMSKSFTKNLRQVLAITDDSRNNPFTITINFDVTTQGV
jgi:hypothetical protein